MIRNVLLLDDGRELRFLDQRKLGMLWLVNDLEPLLQGLGTEPLEDGFTLELLQQRLDGRNAPIKALLCDQTVVAGIGNIYADEVLFAARIHPLKPAVHLSAEEIRGMHHAIRTVLAEAVEKLAGSMPFGGPPTESEEGSHHLRVPREKDTPCTLCGEMIDRVRVRGRSTYYCPACQGSGPAILTQGSR